jgi:hypothetical protein
MIFKFFDKGLLELFGPYGISYILFKMGDETKKVQQGQMTRYATYMFIILLIAIIIGHVYFYTV